MQGPFSFFSNGIFPASELADVKTGYWLVKWASRSWKTSAFGPWLFKWRWTCLTQSPSKVQLTSVTRFQQRGGSLLLLLPHFPHSKLAKGLHHTDQHLPEMEHLRESISCQRSLTSRARYHQWRIPFLFLCQFSSPDDSSHLLNGDITINECPFQPHNSFNSEIVSGNIEI